MTTRDSSILRVAPSQEVLRAVNELSEGPKASNHEAHEEARQDTEGQLHSHNYATALTGEAVHQHNSHDRATSSTSGHLSTEDAPQNVPDDGLSKPPNRPDPRPSIERSDSTPLVVNDPIPSAASTGTTDHGLSSLNMQELIGQVPSLRLSLGQCKDRCGAIVFDVLAEASISEELKQHSESYKALRMELRNAVAFHLGLSSEDPQAKPIFVRFEEALYRKAREELHQAAGLPQPFRPLESSRSFADDQLYCIMMVLRVVDKMLREVDEADLRAFQACCQKAAMKWQLDIHKHWIAELTGEKKRKGRDGEISASQSHKHRRTTSLESEGHAGESAPKRRPGRPPGAKNKASVAPKQRAAARATTRDQSVGLPATPTPAPRAPGIPLPHQFQGYHPHTATPRSIQLQAPHYHNTPTPRPQGQYAPRHGIQPYGNMLQPQNWSSRPVHTPPSQRRGAFSQQDRQIDPSIRHQAEALSSSPQHQVIFENPIINNYYSRPDQEGHRAPSTNNWVVDEPDEGSGETNHERRSN
ncbi:hypothetical protein PMZ80_005770 [Knufia obscura]|uniref:Uncharacterized protein n=2 Tax=Knufia TaxID=430999 RepID=A0AAN8EV44_9EURO|nr:hypothetical protein PMZ80_005770 [Knufia obscura]KAK5954436.1 hypothetical protein OHC33_004158 [Knufia fluminis]